MSLLTWWMKDGIVKDTLQDLPRKNRDLPDNLRLAALGAWRGRERGMAGFAGVFLSSLVITTVLAYGVGLSQAFFEGFLEINVFDAKVEELIYLGDHIRTRASVCGHDDFIVKIPNASHHAMLNEGDTVKFGWSMEDCRALDVSDVR